MKNLDIMFENHKNDWDIYELNSNHQDIFLNELKQKKKKKLKRSYFVPFAVAASLLIMIGISAFYNLNNQPKNLEFASNETRQTDSIFTVLIEKELVKIKEKKSPANEKIIADALVQMKILDTDYQNIIKELETNGESKQLIFAMISNLETRIAFLKSVMNQIEENELLKPYYHENTI